MNAAKAVGEAEKVKVSYPTTRQPFGTLGDVLKETVTHHPYGYTRIKGYVIARRDRFQHSDPDWMTLEFEGVTACIDPSCSVTVHIRDGTDVTTGIALLKAIVEELKLHNSLERFTPVKPVHDYDEQLY
jgi:hypothetical protein